MPILENHDCAIYDLNLRWRGGSQGNDLLLEITGSTSYVVDNNVPWKRLAIELPHSTFVLGATIDQESENLQSVLLGRGCELGFRNVFTFGIDAPSIFAIHRLDKNYAKIQKGPLPRLKDMSEAEIASFNCPAKRDELRARVAEQMRKGASVLDSEIDGILPHCRLDYQRSCNAAELVYARFLLSLGEAEGRKERKKFEINHPNLFGDTRLIQEALLLGIAIVTCDERDVVKMAAIARVTSKRPEEMASQMPPSVVSSSIADSPSEPAPGGQ